ncbi:diguanylate cyclase, partial [Anaplasma marginale]|uniref:diguanylate cyclase n=1 Tax=Anaplasma marginale TaxID=770 RepID=UPI001145A6DA
RVDDLTQIANRRAFKEYLEREWQRGQKHQMPLAVIICSVDFFTEYNNEYGALAGDSCLQNIATTIRDCLLVKQENLVARYDGANFAIAMPNNNALSAAMIAENIRLQIMKLAIKNKNSPISDRLTLSLGVVSLLPNPYNSPEFLNLAAQRALQVAKKQGRNCKIIWNNAELDNINESSSPEVQITFTKTKLKNTYASNKYLRKFI